MAFLISGFLMIAMEFTTGNSEYNTCNMDKTSSKASGGWIPNITMINSITKNASKGGILTTIRARKSVKKVMLAFRSHFLCSVSSCVPKGMIWLRTIFALINNAMYITMGTNPLTICPSAIRNILLSWQNSKFGHVSSTGLMHSQATLLKLKQPSIVGSVALVRDSASTVEHSINITFLLYLLYRNGLKTMKKRSQTNTNMSQLRNCITNDSTPPVILHVCNPVDHCPSIVEIIAAGITISMKKIKDFHL